MSTRRFHLSLWLRLTTLLVLICGILPWHVQALARPPAVEAAAAASYSRNTPPPAPAPRTTCLSPCLASSSRQYALPGSNGITWADMDRAQLSLTLTPSVSCNAILTASADLWTTVAGHNPDLGIAVTGGGYNGVQAWEESDGSTAGAPRSAFVHTVIPMTAGTRYTVKLQWKAANATPGAIMAGAGASTSASPTQLTALCRLRTSVITAAVSHSLTLTRSDGKTWVDMDPKHLSISITPGVNCTALIIGNADLWSAQAGHNQELGISVNGALVAAKESAGLAAHAPDAVLVQAVLPMTARTGYNIKLQWKAAATDTSPILAGAGAGAAVSPTRLTMLCVPSSSISTTVSTRPIALPHSDGTTWAAMDPMSLSITPFGSSDVILLGSADLATSQAGHGQDLGISVSGGHYGAGQIVAWKENGVRAANVPNSAGVEAIIQLAAGTAYTVRLVWKAGDRTAGSIVAGGSAVFPTRLTALLYPGQPDTVPPDPGAVAPPTNPTVATTVSGSTQFLYSGPHPVQTGVAPGTINPLRVAVLRGRVLGRDSGPLPGVAITVAGHPELGRTVSRDDGAYDLAVNGGGLLTVNYSLPGYLSAQRQVQAPWQDYTTIPDVVMIQPDPQVTAVNLSSSTSVQVAQSSMQSDADGSRQATLLFPSGTTAAMKMPDGSTRALSTAHVRATEFTVGPSGPETMPASLPANSGYTYAADFSVDEARAAGAAGVQFSGPIYTYVQNFLGFPVGSPVPAGYYDQSQGRWIASKNGLVIKVLSVTGGKADLDVDGSGQSAGAAALSTLGISDAERATLASQFPAGTSLWRVPITHFSTWDFNWPFAPPPGATPPNQPDPTSPDPTHQCTAPGSIIGCQTQTLGENIGVTGTGFSLHYQSERVPGWKVANTIRIPLIEGTVPSGLSGIELRIEVAGQDISKRFSAEPNQAYTFTWDGKDAYGRPVQGAQPATISIGYTYAGSYLKPTLPDNYDQSFGHYSYYGTGATGDMARSEVTLWQYKHLQMGAWDSRPEGLGGWSLSVHHAYDLQGHVLYLGDRMERRGTQLTLNAITTAAGNGQQGTPADGGQALSSQLGSPKDLAVAPDGTYYMADDWTQRIWRVSPDGKITVFAGNGTTCGDPRQCGDGVPATQAALNYPKGMAVGPDGSLYIADSYNHRIRRVSPNGIISTVAGTGADGFSGDNGPATQAQLYFPDGVAVGPDGSIYVAEWGNNRIRRIGPDGIISTVAGNGAPCYDPRMNCGNGVPALQAALEHPQSITLGPDGSVYFAETDYSRVRRIAPDGIITTVAGIDGSGFSGDGGPATQAHLAEPSGITVGPDGTLYIADFGNERIRQVAPDGTITTIAGSGILCPNGVQPCGDNGPPISAQFYQPEAVALAPDGSLYIADTNDHRIRRVAPTWPGLSLNTVVVPAEDGSELYVFDSTGRHLKTLDALTGSVKYQFGYDSAGRLSSVADAYNNVTAILHDASGTPSAIVAPGGQRTSLTVDSNGYLASVADPAGNAYHLGYDANGLLQTFTDPNNNVHRMTYDPQGRLIKDQDPAGGFTALSRTDTPNGYTVTLTTSLNRGSSYLVERLPEGETHVVNTAPDGTKTDMVEGTDGTTSTLYPNGTKAVLTQGPDPRWGMLAPLTGRLDVTTPGGLTSTTAVTQTVTLADRNNPLSLQQEVTTQTVNGKTSSQAYDAATRTIVSISAAGRKSVTTLDARGRIVSTQQGTLTPVSYSYDSRGRLAAIAQGDRVTTYAYDAQNHLTHITDPLSHAIGFAYDAAGRLAAETLPDGHTVLYSTDRNGNMTQVTPPGKTAHAFGYTAIDRQASYTAPAVGQENSQTQYSYNTDRQLSTVTQPDGSQIQLGYDAAGRLSAMTVPGGQVRYSYDPTTGQLSSVTAPDGGVRTLGYDGALPVNERWSGSAIIGSSHRSFDADSRLTSESVDGANSVPFHYDQDGLLTGVGDLQISRDGQTGFPMATSLGSVSTSQSYNALGDLTSMSASNGSSALFAESYTRDKAGRIDTRTETIGGTASHYAYTYDLAGRLTDVSKDSTTIEHYAYDANGNRTSAAESGVTTTSQYDAQDRLTQSGNATYRYTPGGVLSSKTEGGKQTSYRYDALENLTGVTLPDGKQITYLVDGKNRRIGKEVDGSLQYGFLYGSAAGPIAQLDSGNHVVTRFVYGSRSNVPDFMVRDGVTYRLIGDERGSVRLVVNTATGEVVQRLDYDAYGRVLADSNPGFQPFGYAGGLYDADTGLVRFGARDYDAQTGRWTAKDPTLFAGGQSNLYAYAADDPVNWHDPSGLDDVLAWQISGGFLGTIAAGGAGALMYAVPAEQAFYNVFNAAANVDAAGAAWTATQASQPFSAASAAAREAYWAAGAEQAEAYAAYDALEGATVLGFDAVAVGAVGAAGAFLAGYELGQGIDWALTKGLGEPLGDWIYDKLHPEDKQRAVEPVSLKDVACPSYF